MWHSVWSLLNLSSERCGATGRNPDTRTGAHGLEETRGGLFDANQITVARRRYVADDGCEEKSAMHAMVLMAPGAPLRLQQRDDPIPGAGAVRIKISACGVCRTDLHVVDGELPGIRYPIIPGHEVVGRVDALGAGVAALNIGERVGVPWLGYTCGECAYCKSGRENLCDRPLFTGYTRDGGFATHLVADPRFCFPLGEAGDDVAIAPLLCAGLIGWRSLVMAGEGKHLGIFGFGAAGHIIAQVARWQGRSVYAFTRAGDLDAQALAKSLGAVWTGGSEELPPVPMDAAIIYAPAGELVPLALRAVRKGGRVVCAGIHMSDIPSFPYDILWEERQLLSVANLTRNDGAEFFKVAAQAGIKTHTTAFPLREANEVLAKLRSGQITGAAVLQP
jgi:alcohol dehydrogenase, propanol-preferring